MKLRESGMPEEAYWDTLFDVPLILDRLGIDARLTNLVELGGGYGTFTVPVARRISGTMTTFDIDEAMIERTRRRAAAAGIGNVLYVVRDVFADGFGGEENEEGICHARRDDFVLFGAVHKSTVAQQRFMRTGSEDLKRREGFGELRRNKSGKERGIETKQYLRAYR